MSAPSNNIPGIHYWYVVPDVGLTDVGWWVDGWWVMAPVLALFWHYSGTGSGTTLGPALP